MGHFAEVTRVPGDPILGLLDAYRSDPRTGKLDPGAGVCKGAQDLIPIPRSVKFVEQCLIEQEIIKNHVGGHDDVLFIVRLAELAPGAVLPLLLEQRADATQMPGGTGALRLAGDFIVHYLPDRGTWLSGPTWLAHETLFATVGLEVSHYPYVSTDNRLDIEVMLAGLERIPQGGMVLLRACCHNLIGLDLSRDDWHRMLDVACRHELLPLTDLIYQGFGGGLEEDAWAARLLAGELPEVLVANSCSKNFGLHHGHIGALIVCVQSAERLTDVCSQLAFLARNLWLTPPAHGAEAVAAILGDSELKGLWQEEIEGMCLHTASLRIGPVEVLAPHGLAEHFAYVGAQCGISSYTELSPQQVARLRDEHAVYLVSSSRANVAGLDAHRLDRLVQAIAQVCMD